MNTNINIALNNLEKIKHLILQNKELTFLQLTVSKVNEYLEIFINKYSVDVPESKRTYELNSVLYKDKIIYLSSEGWNKLFRDLQVLYESEYQINVKKYINPDDSANINEFIKTSKNFVGKQFLETSIERILRKVDRTFHTNRKSAIISTLYSIFDYEEGPKVLLSSIQSIVSQEYRHRKDRNRNKFYILGTVFANKIGINTLEFFLIQQPLISKIIKFYKQREDTTNLKEHEIEAFNQLLIAYSNDDEEQLKLFFNNNAYFSICIDITNKILVNLIKNYIFSMISKEYENDNIPFITMKRCVEEIVKEGKMYSYKDHMFNANETLIKLSWVLLEYGATENYHDKYPNLFTIDEIYDTVGTKVIKHKVIYIHPQVISDLLEKHALNKPWLTVSNKNDILKDHKSDNIINHVYLNKENLIHPNKNMQLQYGYNCYLRKYVDNSYFGIHRSILSSFFSNYLLIIKNKELEDLISFSAICYDISFPEMSEDDEKEYVHKMLIYAFSFNEEEEIFNQTNEIIELAKKEKKKYYYKYKTIFNRIVNQKLFLKGALKTIVIYMNFKYFIIDNFIDSRGRRYKSSDFLNTQIYPFLKTFVKPYGENYYNKENYEDFKNMVCNVITADKYKNEIKAITLDKFLIEDSKLALEYIDSFFIKPTTLEKQEELSYLKNYISFNHVFNINNINVLNDVKIINRLIPFIKRKNRTFYVVSLLRELYAPDYYRDPYISMNYELDASNSGFQMTSILLESLQLAKPSNLIGNENNDIYFETMTKFAKCVLFMEKMLFHILQILQIGVGQMDLNDMVDMDTVVNRSIYDKIQNRVGYLSFLFFFMDFQKSTYLYEIINLLYDKLKEKCNLDSLISEYSNENLDWILSKKDRALCNHIKIKVPENHMIFLMKLRNAYRCYSLLAKYGLLDNDNFFTSRQVFKFGIMTRFYNSTSYSRKEKFREAIISYIPNIDQSDINSKRELFILASYLESFFMQYVDEQVSDGKKLGEIAEIIALCHRPIFIENTLFKIKYYPTEEEDIIITTPKINERRGTQLTVKRQLNTYDIKEFRLGFIANFIHAMDAYIAHQFISKCLKIYEKSIKTKNGILMNHDTNHDNFMFTARPFLKIILKDCYKLLHDSKPISWIAPLPKDALYKIEKILASIEHMDNIEFNDRFVKH